MPNDLNPMSTPLYVRCFRGSEHMAYEHVNDSFFTPRYTNVEITRYTNVEITSQMQDHNNLYPENNLKKFSQPCSCTFKSYNISVLVTVFFLKISVLYPKSTISSSS
jgi:hypothetical protein